MPPPSANSFRFHPLGGLGEIGMNCFALEQENDILLVDCGAAFPDDDLGVDVLHPDFSWVRQNESRVRGLVITHGHEDHIGAIPYLLRELESEVPVYAPAHASALIAERLAFHDLSDDCLRLIEGGVRYEIGSFSVEPIPVAHSIIDAYALHIETCAGRVIHTADFDLDSEQPAGHLTDEGRLTALGSEGVRLLLSDSTNVDRERRERNEGEVGRRLGDVIENSAGRVVVGMFSSNIHRIVSLAEAARRTERKLCFFGRSLQRHFDIAKRLGRVDFPSNLFVSPEQVAAMDRRKVLVVAGGSQGEGASSLRRLSQGAHPLLTLDEGDTVVLSARVIPGNEKSVFSMKCDFLRRGVGVVDPRSEPGVHESGHASREELAQMIEWTRPEAFIPVHGTLHHLKRHEELAKDLLVSDTCVVEDGAVVEVPKNGAVRIVMRRAQRPIRIALGGSELGPTERRRRGEMARFGAAFVSLVVDSNGKLVGRPKIEFHGLPGLDDELGARSVLESATVSVVMSHDSAQAITLEANVKRAARGAIFEMCGVKTSVDVHVHEVSVS